MTDAEFFKQLYKTLENTSFYDLYTEADVAQEKYRTEDGVKRYNAVKERAKVRLAAILGQSDSQFGLPVIGDEVMVDVMTRFAMNERGRERAECNVNRHFSKPDPAQPGVGGSPEPTTAWAAEPNTAGQYVDETKAPSPERAQERDLGCFERARALGEPTFTLRAQDVSAPSLVRRWVHQNAATCPPGKLADALACAQAMDAWPHKKAAD